MAYRCHECLYDTNTWCKKYEGEMGCSDCKRLDEEGRCKCLMCNCYDCPDFVPKEDSNEKTEGEN